jgi:hypothetical protein
MHVGIKVMAQTYCFFIYSKSELGIFFIKKNNYGFFSISVTLYKLKTKGISHDILPNFTHFFEKSPLLEQFVGHVVIFIIAIT